MSLDHIAGNYKELLDNINLSCKSCGRDPTEIELVAISKTFPPEQIKFLFEHGQVNFGESKVQELITKYSELKDSGIKWHMVGHLQTNKVKYITGFVKLVHSVDSIKLADEIQKRAANENRIVNVLVQVNTSGEDTKSGVNIKDTKQLCGEINLRENIHLQGLMTIGKLTEVKNEIRENFRSLKNLYDELSNEFKSFKYISMGMTSDYEIAIEEGSNMIRIGSAIFGERNLN